MRLIRVLKSLNSFKKLPSTPGFKIQDSRFKFGPPMINPEYVTLYVKKFKAKITVILKSLNPSSHSQPKTRATASTRDQEKFAIRCRIILSALQQGYIIKADKIST
jgi:hypothetical protein